MTVYHLAYAIVAITTSSLLQQAGASEFGPLSAQLEEGVLRPNQRYHLRVGVGETKHLRFNCLGGAADALIALSTYSETADPLLLVSLDPQRLASIQDHDASSVQQWQEDINSSHYVLARAAGPEGGILSILNMRHFAGQTLDAVLNLHCAYIVAFDMLFWDHLKSSEVCPVGARGEEVGKFCSGHGTCAKRGACKCDGGFIGAACEHRKRDQVVDASGNYHFQVAPGQYQFFRVRVPPNFPGGLVDLKVRASQPVVVLMSERRPPTRTQFEMSNFNTWLRRQTDTHLQFQVKREGQFARLPAPPRDGRPAPEPGNSCPRYGPPPSPDPLCVGYDFDECERSCGRCMECVPGGPDDRGCTAACDACLSDRCTATLRFCAGNYSCTGPEAQRCDKYCSPCMACMGSDDDTCAHRCNCCLGCVPLGVKCMPARGDVESSRFVYVGIFNHGRYHRRAINAEATLTLKEDDAFGRHKMFSNWLAEMYNPFVDLGTLDATFKEVYPDGRRFVYDLVVRENSALKMRVNVYKDRMTLLHIDNAARGRELELTFLEGADVTHVLSSTRALPKTLFDMDQVHAQANRGVTIVAEGRKSIWCAIFGASDGQLGIVASARHEAANARTSAEPGNGQGNDASIRFALLCVFSLLCGLVVLGLIYGCAQKLGDAVGVGSSDRVPISERLSNLLRPHGPHESTSSLMRAGSMHGYLGGDVLDRSVEDQYMHRGGMGDDGI